MNTGEYIVGGLCRTLSNCSRGLSCHRHKFPRGTETDKTEVKKTETAGLFVCLFVNDLIGHKSCGPTCLFVCLFVFDFVNDMIGHDMFVCFLF